MIKKIIAFAFTLFLLFSCTQDKSKNYVVIGVPNDVETLNPLYAFNVTEGEVSELLFLPLIESSWDFESGEIKYSSLLAKEWHWINNDAIEITLRSDAYWSDGVQCSIDDVIFSLDIYSDSKVQSRAIGYFDKFYLDKNGKIDSEKTFDVISENKLRVNFAKGSNPSLLDIDHPILPKHFFEKIKREEISTVNINDSLVVNGPYKIEQWKRGESVVLRANPKSFLNSEKVIPKIIFKVLPEYRMRLGQLLQGEIDFMEDIKTDDIEKINNNSELVVSPISGRDFDYIGWNNIDVEKYDKGVIAPNPLFGSSKVRSALTIAINREAVINQFLNGYGQLASSPISPILKKYYESKIQPSEFNPQKAIKMLALEGWSDHNGNGTIDKNGVEFEFTLHIPSGNPRREFAASLFQNNLKALGIEMQIESNEIGSFIDNLFEKNYNAWMAAWVIPLPINLQISWNSDLKNTPLNFPSYQNKKIDKLLKKLNGTDESKVAEIYKKIGRILAEEQPYSFLYWIDNIVAYNKSIKNISPSPLGVVNQCWKWEL